MKRKVVLISIALSMGGGASDQALGTWSGPIDLGRRAIHVVMAPSNTPDQFGRPRLLILNRHETNQEHYRPAICVPADDTYTSFTITEYTNQEEREMFCSGHVTLANGTPFLAGGHKDVAQGIIDGQKFITLFSSANAWVAKTDMHKARWYPTVLRMPNGDTLTMMGHYLDANNVVQANFKPTLWVDNVPGAPTS